jgi:photosynthetic reaction center cytochrome c subunit
MNLNIPPFAKFLGAVFVLAIVALGFFALPLSTENVQTGYRGTGMELVINANTLEEQLAENEVPAEPWPREETTDGPLASEVYENVQVLGHLQSANFDRLMAAITEWVSPEQGCAYCHGNEGNFAADDNYAKLVSRRMIQMTQHINSEWTNHVAGTGVTCYACHQGQPVPAEIWFDDPDALYAGGMIGDRAGQNIAAPEVGLASLPQDIFSPYFVEDMDIRVNSQQPLPGDSTASIKQTEWTYGLMIHMSESLGVNCTYCHNTNAIAQWDQAPPQRATAWHGIRMLREINNEYLIPLRDTYPDNRLGPLGDAPKANCATCHNGVYRPLFGAQMLADYPSLTGPGPADLQDPPMEQMSELLTLPDGHPTVVQDPPYRQGANAAN